MMLPKGALQAAVESQATFADHATMLVHAIALGALLMIATYRVCFEVEKLARVAAPLDMDRPTPLDLVYSSANILFISIGMAGVMILVNNSLARAFAIGAAIALVRFRIKMDSSSFGISLFFGVLIGMACGVSQFALAWMMGAVFLVLQTVVLQSAKSAMKGFVAPVQPVVVPSIMDASPATPAGLTLALGPTPPTGAIIVS